MKIDRENRRARFSASGKLLPEEAAELATSALSAAGAENLQTVVLDFKQSSLTRRMTVTECHHVGERLARAGKGLLKVAVLTPSECVEPHSFLFTVAVNRGLRVATFLDDADADSWLATPA